MKSATCSTAPNYQLVLCKSIQSICRGSFYYIRLYTPITVPSIGHVCTTSFISLTRNGTKTRGQKKRQSSRATNQVRVPAS